MHDPWLWGLMVLNLPGDSEYLAFEQLVERAEKVEGVFRKAIEGTELVVAELRFAARKGSGESWKVEVCFDPGANYLVRRVSYRLVSGSKVEVQREETVRGFREVAPAVFFPERVDGRTESGGTLLRTRSAEFFDVEVNRPLAADAFRLSFPHGIIMSDSVRGVNYRVDEQGNQISKDFPTGKIPPPPMGEPSRARPGEESVEEPRSILHWLLPISLALLVVGGALAGWRRWRARR
jgi:hypothetical protein